MTRQAVVRWLALALAGIGMGLALGTLVLVVLGSDGPDADTWDVVAGVEIAAFPLLVAPLAGIITARRPGQPVGWLLGGLAAIVGLSQFTSA